MNLDDFMDMHFKEGEVKEEPKTTVMGPTGMVCWPHTGAAECEVADDEEDDELEFTYEIDGDDLITLKDTYDLLDDIVTWILCDDVDFPKELAKKLQMAAGDVHFLINQFDKYRPQDAGYPDILSTIEDKARDVNLRTEKVSK